MAKKGINFADVFTVTSRDGKQFLRKRHNAGNARNQARNECIKKAMSGRSFAGKEGVHAAFAQAARSCANSR